MAAMTPEFSPDELNELLSGLTPDIPDCRVMRLIGRGGMSYVYLGIQESLERQVAIKVIAPDALKDEVSKARFEKESRTIAKLQHPCIVGIHAVGRSEQGLLYYILPYLAKGHLGLRDLTNNDAAVIDVLRALLSALDYAHAHGVVHRDVKAENVLFDNADKALLADFGIAFSRRDRSRVTSGGFAIGSSAHMAPEQARGELVDGRADLYSLGVLTYEMVCGELPFQNPDALGLALMHAVDPVPRLPATKRHWQAFIDKAMAKSPTDRFASARDMLAALEGINTKPGFTLPRLPALPQLADAWNRWRLPMIGVTAVIVALLLSFAFWPSDNTPSETAVGDTAIAVTTSAIVADEAAPAELSPIASDPLLDGDSEDSLAESDDSAEEPLESEAEALLALPPGERALANAAQQITRRRLTQPPGGNAYESLLSAKKLLPDSPQLARLGESWLSAATPYIVESLNSQDRSTAISLFGSASQLTDALALRDSASWSTLDQTVAGPILERIKSALQSKDPAALAAAKASATEFGIPSSRFEPYWSRKIVTRQVGDVLQRGGTRMVLVSKPTADRPGMAILPSAVSRSDYAAFVADTRRSSANCRIRTALVTLKKRSWDKPGFEQTGDHPVVCVSLADALAYASWLGKRDGVSYALPSRAEWLSLTGASTSASCGSGGITCAADGTRAMPSDSASRPQIRSLQGNVREWPSDCAGCREHPTMGLGWRDGSATRENDNVDPGNGYDDVSFRLVRDVSQEEIDQR